jgi:hypothetical protein
VRTPSYYVTTAFPFALVLFSCPSSSLLVISWTALILYCFSTRPPRETDAAGCTARTFSKELTTKQRESPRAPAMAECGGSGASANQSANGSYGKDETGRLPGRIYHQVPRFRDKPMAGTDSASQYAAWGPRSGFHPAKQCIHETLHPDSLEHMFLLENRSLELANLMRMVWFCEQMAANIELLLRPGQAPNSGGSFWHVAPARGVALVSEVKHFPPNTRPLTDMASKVTRKPTRCAPPRCLALIERQDVPPLLGHCASVSDQFHGRRDAHRMDWHSQIF